MADEEKQIEGQGRDIEGRGTDRSSGLPAAGKVDGAANEPLNVTGRLHWRESTITRPSLEERGGVFFAAVEMTRMPMILTDPRQADNPIAFANKAFLDLTGYEESEVLGRNCRFLQGPQTDRNVVAELREAVAARTAISVEILNYKRDGTPFWNGVFIGPVYDVAGELLFFFASQLDVTRRRDSEQRLREAQKMESIGQLTAGLAHDFNNLLQAISGNLELLTNQVSGERSHRLLNNARSAADRGAKLTKQLLAFARKARLEPALTNLSDLIHDFGDLAETTLGRDIDLQTNTRRRLPLVSVDPDQFEMALLNILINSRDAMPTGGAVTLSTYALHLNGDAAARELPSGDYVVLEVADTGSGMPAHVARRATEPFFTTKGVGKGTGLGLAMAAGFVQQSRGRLEIDSREGEGTTIRLIFPASAAAADKVTGKPSPEPVRTDRAGGGEHILIVEDQEEVRELACEFLEAAGYRVTAVANGDDGFVALQQAAEPFALVFTDILMPGSLSGLELADRIREVAPETPVLLTTGYNEDLAAQGGERLGLDVIGKPYRRAELLDRIGQALDQKHGAGARRNASDFGSAEA